MDIESIYVWKENEKPKANHHFLFPRSIRGLIVGKSNCGKTTLLNNLLLKDGYLDYTRLLVYGASLHQIEYKLMKAAFEKKLSKDQIRVLFERQKLVQRNGGPEKVIHDYDGVCKGNINTDFFSHGEKNVPDPTTLDPSEKNLLILDDVMTFSQKTAEDYFTRGRHNNVDVFYITQSYHELPRRTIRENSNFLILFQQDDKNLRHIYDDWCSNDKEILPYPVFKSFCVNVWTSKAHNFVVIDSTRQLNTGKYRKNLNYFWYPPTA